MQVLVVGGAGYIGSHVVLELQAAGHQVIVYDNMSTGRQQNLHPKVRFVKGDILDCEALSRLFRTIRIEAVVHLAALKAAGASMETPEQYGHHNITGSINLINAAATGGVAYFVFSSSAAVYGKPEYLPIDEAHPINPANFYGYTKFQIESHLAWFSKLRNMRVACLRYFNAAGYDKKGRVPGLEIRPENLIPIVMEVAAGTRKKLQIFGTDYDTRDGTCIRDYIHVTELARAHVSALEYQQKEDKDLTVNLGSEQGYTVLEVLHAAEKVVGKAIDHELVGRREGDPVALVASAAHAKELLNWRAQDATLESLLTSTWALYKQQP